MGTLRDTLSPQELALHDSYELLPISAKLVAEDIETGHIVLSTADQATTVLADKPSE